MPCPFRCPRRRLPAPATVVGGDGEITPGSVISAAAIGLNGIVSLERRRLLRTFGVGLGFSGAGTEIGSFFCSTWALRGGSGFLSAAATATATRAWIGKPDDVVESGVSGTISSGIRAAARIGSTSRTARRRRCARPSTLRRRRPTAALRTRNAARPAGPSSGAARYAITSSVLACRTCAIVPVESKPTSHSDRRVQA